MAMEIPDVPTSDQALEILQELTEVFHDSNLDGCKLCILRGTLLLAAYAVGKVEVFFHEDGDSVRPVFGAAGDDDGVSQELANAVEDLVLSLDATYEVPMGASGPVRKMMFAKLLQLLRNALAELDLDITDIIKIVIDLLDKG